MSRKFNIIRKSISHGTEKTQIDRVTADRVILDHGVLVFMGEKDTIIAAYGRDQWIRVTEV